MASKSTLDGDDCQHAVDAKSSCTTVINTQLLLSAPTHVCQPPVVLVPETVPQDFVEISDGNELQNEPDRKNDDCAVICADTDCPVACHEHDSYAASSCSHMQPSTLTGCPENISPGSPVFNRQCTTVPVSSSPSLFDDEEEKRLHQRNLSMNLLLTSKEKSAAMGHICSDVSQPSPSVLSSKLGVNASAHRGYQQNNCNVNVDRPPPTMLLASQLQCRVSERAGMETADEVKCENGSDCSVKMKVSHVQSSDEMLHNGLDTTTSIPTYGADDKFCCTETLDVNRMPAADGQLGCDVDMMEVSTARTGDQQNDLLASRVMCELSDCQQPSSKKQRCEAIDSRRFLYGSACAMSSVNSAEDSGK